MLAFDRRLFFYIYVGESVDWGYARGRLRRVGRQRTARTIPAFWAAQADAEGLMGRSVLESTLYTLSLP